MSPDLDVMESRIELLANEALGRLGRSAGALAFERPVSATDTFVPSTDNADSAGMALAPATLRIGIDLATVTDIAGSIEHFGDRYLERLFTHHELSVCGRGLLGGESRWSVESLAARFAAKEAVVKVLRPVGPRPDWKGIEIHRTEAGWCEVRLFGRAQELADAAGIAALAVSMTHEGSMAAAVVVASCNEIGRANSPLDTKKGKV